MANQGRQHVSGSAWATTNHGEIRRWVEEHGGFPAAVKRTHRGAEPGILRIDFPGFGGEKTLQRISWDEFFTKFDDSDLAFLFQDETRGGRPSNFNKLVQREHVEASPATSRGMRTNGAGRGKQATQSRSNAATTGRSRKTATSMMSQGSRGATKTMSQGGRGATKMMSQGSRGATKTKTMSQGGRSSTKTTMSQGGRASTKAMMSQGGRASTKAMMSQGGRGASSQRRSASGTTQSKQARVSTRSKTQTKTRPRPSIESTATMRATDLLREQHQQVLGLFERLHGRGGNRRSREKIFDELLANCAMHFDIEEQVFYPGLKKRSTQEQLLESAEEHLGCKRILADLIDLGPDDGTYLPKMEVLRRLILEHVEREENELFPIAERQLKQDQQIALAQEMIRVMDDLRAGGDITDHITEHTEEAAPI